MSRQSSSCHSKPVFLGRVDWGLSCKARPLAAAWFPVYVEHIPSTKMSMLSDLLPPYWPFPGSYEVLKYLARLAGLIWEGVPPEVLFN